MSYDPFVRGRHPVGVRTTTLDDAKRVRSVPVEIWYPADEKYRGQDFDASTCDRFQLLAFAPETSQDAVRDASPQPGRYPLILFSHGWSGHRRQSTHLCTHLASHGYLVASVDHIGNTITDLIPQMVAARGGEDAPDGEALANQSALDRPRDVSFVVDALLRGESLPSKVHADPDRIGVAGHSFGGWTALMVAGRDDRIGAALPLAPAGGRSPMAEGRNLLRDTLDLDWPRAVPTLYLAAECDSLCPLDGVRELWERTPGPSRLITLADSDHMHFSDRVEEAHELFRSMGSIISEGMRGGPDIVSILGLMKPIDELVSGDVASHFTRALGLAHMDAALRKNAEATDFLESDLTTLFAEHGIPIRSDEPGFSGRDE